MDERNTRKGDNMKKVANVYKEFFSIEGSLFRYSLSYCLLLALLPSLILMIVLFQNSIFDLNEILQYLYQFIPSELLEPFINYILKRDYSSMFSLIVALVTACYLASKSFFSFMMISSTQEEFKTYKILIRIKSVFLFVLFLGSVIGIGLVAHFLNLNAYFTYGTGLVVVFYFLYRLLSFEKRPVTYGLLGAIFVSVSIVCIGYGFFNVVQVFTSYESVYGSFSSLVILFLSVYVIASVMYLGYCINFIYGKSYAQTEYKSIWFYEHGERIIDAIKKIFTRGKKK